MLRRASNPYAVGENGCSPNFFPAGNIIRRSRGGVYHRGWGRSLSLRAVPRLSYVSATDFPARSDMRF